MKLVRNSQVFDEADEQRFVIHRAEHTELLKAKLREECAEVIAAPTDKSEYGDVMQVLEDLGALHGISFTDMLIAMQIKATQKGTFSRGVIWTNNPEVKE